MDGGDSTVLSEDERSEGAKVKVKVRDRVGIRIGSGSLPLYSGHNI